LLVGHSILQSFYRMGGQTTTQQGAALRAWSLGYNLATTTNADAAASANVLHAEDDWIWIRDDWSGKLMVPRRREKKGGEGRTDGLNGHWSLPFLASRDQYLFETKPFNSLTRYRRK
jgi:hypothetical protein